MAGYMQTAKKDDWGTPQALFDRLNKIYKFTLDAAASAENAKCELYFTKEQDAFKQTWAPHRVFLNPPYGRMLGRWINKAYVEMQKGALVVALLPARTDTLWFHDHCYRKWCVEIEFLKGRLKFEGALYGATFPSMIVVFGDVLLHRL